MSLLWEGVYFHKVASGAPANAPRDRSRSVISIAFRSIAIAFGVAVACLPRALRAQQPDLGTLNIVVSEGTGVPAWPLNHGNELGAWKGSGLQVNLISGTTGNVAQIMAAGQADVVFSSSVLMALAICHGLPAKIVGAQALLWAQNIVASTKSNISDVAGLKGHTFGVSSFASQGYYSVLKLAQSQGWTTADYKVAQLANIGSLSAALKSNSIQAFTWNSQQVELLVDQGIGKDLGPTDPYIGPIVSETIVVRDDVLKSRPAAVHAFLNGYFATVRKYIHDPKTVGDVIEKEEKQPAGSARALQENINVWSTDGDMPQANRRGLEEAVVALDPSAKSCDRDTLYYDWRQLP